MSTKRILTTTAVVAILGLLVYFQVRHWRSFDWARFGSASRVDPWHVSAAVALIYVTYVLRALRWKIFLEPVRKSRTAFLVPPTFIGFTGLALFGRPGELIRPYLIARRERLSLTSQIGVWAVERIFDAGAFTVLMTIDVFFSSAIRANPYWREFRGFALVLCALVAMGSLLAFGIRKRGHQVAAFFHKVIARFSSRMAHLVDEKIRSFGEGLNTISGGKALLRLIGVSLLMWFMIALAYREVAHSYPPEPVTAQSGPPAVDVETASLAGLPESAGQPLTDDMIQSLDGSLEAKGYSLRNFKGDVWLFRQKKKIKKVG